MWFRSKLTMEWLYSFACHGHKLKILECVTQLVRRLPAKQGFFWKLNALAKLHVGIFRSADRASPLLIHTYMSHPGLYKIG